MQIEYTWIVKWLGELFAGLTIIVASLMLFIWRGDRARLKTLEGNVPPDLVPRLKTLEDKMQHAVTLPQVEHIVEKVEKHFKEDHSNLFHGQETILRIVGEGQKELKEYIKDMFEAREGHWNGRDRRKQ